MRSPSSIFIQEVVCERGSQGIRPTGRLRGSLVTGNGVGGSHENVFISRRLNCGCRGPHKPIPGLSALRGGECIPEVLNLAQGRLDSFEDCRLQGRVVANELVNSRPDKNSVLLVLKDALMSLRGENRKQAWNDCGSRSELILTSLIKT